MIYEQRAHDLVDARRVRRRALALPHSAFEILTGALHEARGEQRPRAWTLPPTELADEIQHYVSRQTSLAISGPTPKLRTSINKATAEELALKVNAAVNFLELSREADPFVKPILIYYSFSHLLSALTHAFLEWEGERPSHGLRVAHARQNIGATAITVGAHGGFPRLVVALFLLSGRPSAFAPLITYSGKPTAHVGQGELLERFGREERGRAIKHLTLEELARFDYRARLKDVRLRHGFHKLEGLSSTAFLLDMIAVYMASSFARYDVVGWRSILEGHTNQYFLYFDEVFTRLHEFAFDRILEMLHDPSTQLDAAISPTQESPYSNRATRFPSDVSAAT